MPTTLEPLESIHAERLVEAMRIYGEAFPLHEQISTAAWLEVIRSLPDPAKRLLAVVNEAGETAGMIYLEIRPPVAVLWYLCTRRDLRGGGLGRDAYAALVRELFASGLTAMVFEVEKPEEARRQGEEAESLARRRVAWYRRNGAVRLLGVDYLQTVDTGLPATPMDLMIHVPTPVAPEEAYRLACFGLEEEIPRAGDLLLE